SGPEILPARAPARTVPARARRHPPGGRASTRQHCPGHPGPGRCTHSPGGSRGEDVAQVLADVAADVEACALHGRIVTMLEDPRPHARLHALADPPVLSVDQVPELYGIRRIKPRLRHLGWVKEKVADDRGTLGPLRPYGERGDVIGREGQQEVGVDQLTLVPDLFVVVQPGKRSAAGGAGTGEGPGSIAMRNTAVPVELGPALLPEGGHDLA